MPASAMFVSKAAAKTLACVSGSLLRTTGLANHAITPDDLVAMNCMCGCCMHSQVNKAEFAANIHSSALLHYATAVWKLHT
jgi:hypothetical protein